MKRSTKDRLLRALDELRQAERETDPGEAVHATLRTSVWWADQAHRSARVTHDDSAEELARTSTGSVKAPRTK